MGENPGQVFKEIQIDFGDFAKMFDSYATQLKATESVWRNIAGLWKDMRAPQGTAAPSAQGAPDSAFRNDSAAAKTLINIEKGQKQFTKANDDWNKGFFNLMTSGNLFSRISKGILSSNLFKFGLGLTGVGGALYGIDRLAESVATNRFKAMALGAPYGAMRATNLAFGGLAQPEQEMESIAAGQRDITSTQYRALMTLGFNRKQLDTMDPSEILSRAIPKVHELGQRFHGASLMPQMEARGITSIFDPATISRLKNASDEEIKKRQQEALELKSQLDLDKEAQKAYSDLIRHIEEAGATIITVLQKDLLDLDPGLKGLTKAVDDTNKLFTEFIKDATWFAKWFVDQENSAGSLLSTINMLNDAGQALGKAMHDWILSWFPGGGGKKIDWNAPVQPNWFGGGGAQAAEVQDKPLLDYLKQASLIPTDSLLSGGGDFPGKVGRASTGRTTSGRGGGGGGSAEAIGPIDLGDPEAKVGSYSDAMRVMMKAGLTYKEAAGLSGEATAESGLGTIRGGKVLGVGTGDSGAASGMAQWHSDRWNRQVAWAKSQGLDPSKPSTQYKMMAHEYITEWRKRLGARINAADTPAGIEAATEPFEGSAYGPGRGSAVSGTARALREGKGLGPQSMNDLTNYQGAHPSHFVKLNVNNQAGANVIVQGGMLGAGNGQFQVA